MATTPGPLKMTAFIVSLAIAFPGSYLFFLGIIGKRKCKTGNSEHGKARHVARHFTAKV